MEELLCYVSSQRSSIPTANFTKAGTSWSGAFESLRALLQEHIGAETLQMELASLPAEEVRRRAYAVQLVQRALGLLVSCHERIPALSPLTVLAPADAKFSAIVVTEVNGERNQLLQSLSQGGTAARIISRTVALEDVRHLIDVVVDCQALLEPRRERPKKRQ